MTVIRLVIIAPFRLSASFLTESRDCTTARQGATTMVACSFCKSLGLRLYESPAGYIDAINTPWVRWSALGLGKFQWWKEKMATPRRINCVTFSLWEGNDGLTSQYSQRLPAEYAGPSGTPLMGMTLLDLGQFNDWNEKIEWLSMAEKCDN